jgi:3-phenylpropionate/trans-cinnamate dioxygenase ferredoxin subunit
MPEFLVTTTGEIPSREARCFAVDGREIVLCTVNGRVYALQALCTHQALPLDGGEVEDGVLTCEWHGAQFDVCSGRVLALPATRPVCTYPVRVEERQRVFVTLPE